jgi:hypothetical protein
MLAAFMFPPPFLREAQTQTHGWPLPTMLTLQQFPSRCN